MMQQIKKYFSVLLLFLFLFPQIEKEVHAFHHLADAHCSSSDKHFHEQEHNCSICDYTITNTTTAETPAKLTVTVQQFIYSPFVVNINTTNAYHHLPARAPPIA